MESERSKEMKDWSWLKFKRVLPPVDKKRYISEKERRKCKRVIAAFEDMYMHTDMLVLDMGVYGFVKLQEYTPPFGFDTIDFYTDSSRLFEDLWTEWRDSQMICLIKGTPLEVWDFRDLYFQAPPHIRKEIYRIKRRMMIKAGLHPLRKRGGRNSAGPCGSGSDRKTGSENRASENK